MEELYIYLHVFFVQISQNLELHGITAMVFIYT